MKCKYCGEDYPSKFWFKDDNSENMCNECYAKGDILTIGKMAADAQKKDAPLMATRRPSTLSFLKSDIKMKSRISIIMLIIGVLLSVVGGYLVYDTKYHRLFWSSSQEFEAMIPGIILGVVGLVLLVFGIIVFISSGRNIDD